MGMGLELNNVELLRLASAAELARAAATAWVEELTRRDAGRDYTVALPGGRIATAFLAAAVELIRARGLSLAGVHFFWADERCVPPSSADSNFALAQAALFQPLAIPAYQIHRLRGEADPQFAVAEADAELCRLADLGSDGMPVMDLVFLGLGEDGHVASLFPNASPAVLAARGPFLHITDSPKPPPQRITVSYPVLFAARQVWVLASGAGKEAALRASLAPNGQTPLGRVLSGRTATRVFTDIAL
jgi:6-phosphogluconolactonase